MEKALWKQQTWEQQSLWQIILMYWDFKTYIFWGSGIEQNEKLGKVFWWKLNQKCCQMLLMVSTKIINNIHFSITRKAENYIWSLQKGLNHWLRMYWEKMTFELMTTDMCRLEVWYYLHMCIKNPVKRVT